MSDLSDRPGRVRGSTRKVGVIGWPIEHTLSPVIHNAGYAAAGLTGWSYTAIECGAEVLADLVAGLGPEWAGMSVTMPGKEAALAAAGLIEGPMASGPFMRWGKPGKGKWITIYTNPGHMFMVVAGVRFDTVARGQTGSRWINTATDTSGYVARHPPGF